MHQPHGRLVLALHVVAFVYNISIIFLIFIQMVISNSPEIINMD